MPKTPKSTEKPERAIARVAGLVEPSVTHFSARTTERGAQEVRFGRVVVEAELPPEAVEKRNIAAGHLALSRAKNALLRPGVQVRVDVGVPLYHADPKSPGLLVRTLNGHTTRGRFTGGKFKPT